MGPVVILIPLFALTCPILLAAEPALPATLERLFFIDARLNLPALEKLKALPNLKSLDMMQVDIPPEDIDEHRAELPNAKIQRRPPLTEAEHKRLDQFLKVP
jgi:hypothetical protein